MFDVMKAVTKRKGDGEKNRMEGVEMHMVSGGRVVDWNDIKELGNGAMVQVIVNIQGGMGKRGKEEEERE